MINEFSAFKKHFPTRKFSLLWSNDTQYIKTQCQGKWMYFWKEPDRHNLLILDKEEVDLDFDNLPLNWPILTTMVFADMFSLATTFFRSEIAHVCEQQTVARDIFRDS